MVHCEGVDGYHVLYTFFQNGRHLDDLLFLIKILNMNMNFTLKNEASRDNLNKKKWRPFWNKTLHIAYTGLPVVRVRHKEKALNWVVLNCSLPVNFFKWGVFKTI